MPSFPASRNGASSPDAVSTVPKRLLLSLCVSCSSPNVLSSLIFLSFFPGKIPKMGRQMPGKKNLHSAGHYGPEDAGNLHPPFCASPAFETGTSRDMTCFSGTEKPVSLSKKNKKKSYDHE